MFDIALLLPIFVLSCVVVGIIIFSTMMSGKHLLRDALIAYLIVMGIGVLIGAACAGIMMLFDAL